MSMFGSQIASIHSDVLSANPENNESKRDLVSEIKSRAKNVLGSKNYPEAIDLYSKGIEIIPEDDVVEKSILYSNRSMCHSGMGKFADAESDAQKSIDLNASYTKAYFRKTAALIGQKKYKEARECVLIGLGQLPNDKDLQAQLVKIDAEIKTSNASTSSSSGAIKSTKSAAASGKENASKPAMEVQDDHHEELTDIVRGYKKLDDGRVTTFFNNTLDEKTKALIGDIAPKKIESSGDLSTIDTSSQVGSSWNAAGTYESRDLSSWALEFIKENFNNDHIGGDLKTSNQNYKFVLKVTEVKDVTGDAQIVITRGKRKHVCDLTFSLVWQLSIEHFGTVDGKKLEKLEGTLCIQDFSADGDYDLSYTISTKVENKDNSLVKMAKDEIEKKIQQALQLFVHELKSKV